MKKIWHHFNLWEEYHNGLWKQVHGKERDELLQKAIVFTGDHELYGRYMITVLDEWPYSCEVNLSDSSMNRQAWIGHAACCIAIECPESITRAAWHCLSQEQQDKANHQADLAIAEWERRYKEKKWQSENSGQMFLPLAINE